MVKALLLALFCATLVSLSFSKTCLEDNAEVLFEKFGTKFDLNLQPNSENILCNRQLDYFQESFDQNALWARKMRDAWGNFPSGIYSGNFLDFGNFDQCINIKHRSEHVGVIAGQYCLLMISFDSNVSMSISKISTPSRS